MRNGYQSQNIDKDLCETHTTVLYSDTVVRIESGKNNKTIDFPARPCCIMTRSCIVVLVIHKTNVIFKHDRV
jgi:hypothetical protein